jgi:hypothetical protein
VWTSHTLQVPCASPWPHLDAALELGWIGRDQQDALVRGCLDGDIRWRVRDEHGKLLERPDWTGKVDWSAPPPRFEIAEPLYFFVPGTSMPTSGPKTWCVVEVERQSLRAYFDEPEPLAVRIVGPILVQLMRAAIAKVGHAIRGRKPSGNSRAADIIKALEDLVARGQVEFRHGGLAAAARALSLRFPEYTEDGIRKIIKPLYHDFREKHSREKHL